MVSFRDAYEQRRVLVTGADGFIGSHLVEALAAADAKVTALALYNSFGTAGWLDEIDNQAIEISRGDVRAAAFVNELVAGHDVGVPSGGTDRDPLLVRRAAVLRRRQC